jgi:hypothetical protein
MLFRNLANCCSSAIIGATIFAFSMGPASAFTLSGPSLEQPVASAQIEKVWCNRWGCHPGYWHGGGGWGWRGPGWGARCWRGYYGHLHCN